MSAVSTAATNKSRLSFRYSRSCALSADPPSSSRTTAYPAPSTARSASRGSISPAKYLTVALSLAKFTLASTTPGTLFNARSTRPMQPAQVIPVTPKVVSRTSASYPAPLIAQISSPRLVAPTSYSTVALPMAKFARVSHTPSCPERTRSTRRTQDPHVIPVTGIATLSMFRVFAAKFLFLSIYYTSLPYIRGVELSRLGRTRAQQSR